MKDAIRLGVTGIEILNSRYKILKLQGWSSEATRDMDRYDRSLTKLYTRYMRRGSVSPIVELGFCDFRVYDCDAHEERLSRRGRCWWWWSILIGGAARRCAVTIRDASTLSQHTILVWWCNDHCSEKQQLHPRPILHPENDPP